MIMMTIPTVEVLTIVLGFSVGYLWGESFSGTDSEIKYETKWYLRRHRFWQWVIEKTLDATHHFQYGIGLMLLVLIHPFFEVHPFTQLILLWLGWGLVVSDWKDYKNILKRLGLNGDE